MMKKPQLCILIFILLISSSMSLAEEDTWTKKADMPAARACLSICALNGKIYAIGGVTIGIGGFAEPTVEEYDPATDTWTRKADMPTARAWLSTSAVNGKIYAIGGFAAGTVTSAVEEYDPVVDTWTKKADMPTPRSGFSSAVNGKIHVIGGESRDRAALSTVEVYDPATDTWTTKADMPTARALLSVSAVDGKIHAIGGATQGSPYSGIVSTVEEYDPATDTWTKKADMPTPRFTHTSAVNGKIYAIGGSTTGSPWTPISTVEEYDTGMGIPWIRVVESPPQEGSITGGTPIAILGSNFPPGVSVTIGGNPLTQMEVTDTLIRGITPRGTEGEWDIIITARPDYSVFAGKFIYKPPSNVVVTRIAPTNGKQAGGDMGIIAGSGFLPGATVTIGDAPATDVGVTPTLITFTIPPGAEGAKDVVVTNPDGQRDMLRDGYSYSAFPVIEKVEPKYGGPLRGGTEITITGNHFMEGVVITIGEERVTKLDLFSPTELRLKTPPGEAGPKTVRVVNPDGQEAILEEGFTYNPAPTISSVKPNAGPLEGGARIVITGTGFIPTHPGVDVLIGGAEARVRGASSTEITAETPPSTPGVKGVVVINRDGQKAALEAGFTYNPLPDITRVIPDNGRLAGGTEITIRGSGFLPGARVLISTETGTFRAASSIQVVSPAIIMAVTPPGEPGPKDVVILNPDKQVTRIPEGFTYNPMPTIIRITPDFGAASGGTKLTIEGTGFLQGARVMIGKRVGTTMVKDDETIEAVTPPNPPGLWDVRVINPDTQEAVMREAFVSVGELVYNYPNPFRASEGTTFRYVTNQPVDVITVRIFNLRGVPIGIVRGTGSNEVRWYKPSVHVGIYVYLLEARLEDGQVRRFKNMLEVCK